MKILKSLLKPLFFVALAFVICTIWIIKNIRPMELINDIVKDKTNSYEKDSI